MLNSPDTTAANWTHWLTTPGHRRVHLVGIGGAGLSAIAHLLLQRGLRVSGSDQRPGPATAELAALGAQVFIGHDAAHVASADLVLISSAVPASNPEVQAALAAGIPVVKREQFLAPLMAGHRRICVAGAHGKTTTSAMIAALLDALGAEPSFIVGSTVLALGTAARAGRPGGPFVIEADEYDHMFLGLQPDLAVITNVEWDHVDCYPNLEDFQQAFLQFAERVTPGGRVLYCGDDPGARALYEKAVQAGTVGDRPEHEIKDRPEHEIKDRPERTSFIVHPSSFIVQWVSYGLEAGNQWRAGNLQPASTVGSDGGINGVEFDIWHEEKLLGRVSIPLSGEHNVRNALAALAATHLADYDVFSKLRENLKLSRIFAGTKRRLEVIGNNGGIIILDDYAHHPTEVRATLGAARQRFPRRPIWVLFQPHTYSRTRALLDEFRDSFENADHVLITDIYAAREHDTLGISALDVVRRLAHHPDARYAGDLDAATRLLLAELQSGDLLITLGAGDGDRVGRQVLAGLDTAAYSTSGGQAAGLDTAAYSTSGGQAAGLDAAAYPTGGGQAAGLDTAAYPTGGGQAAGLDTAAYPTSGGQAAGLDTAAYPTGGGQAAYEALAAAIAGETGLALRRDEPLASHTTLRVGGPADLFVAVSTVEDLMTVLARARDFAVPVLVLGGGSNLLVSDRGVRGLVVANGCRAVRRHEGNVLWAEAGANLAGVARQAMRWGLAGLEWGVSVPGTVGGALVGNAGAHGGCVADSLLRATLLNPDGSLAEWPAARFAYGYRSSALKSLLRASAEQSLSAGAGRASRRAETLPVVLAAAFQLQEGVAEQMEARAASFLAHRRSTQPVEASAGSTFQNPPGDYAGRIIEALGLKGHAEGHAAFSTVHANFVVNQGGARAADVTALINLARQTAWRAMGVELTPEILFVGDWAEPPLQALEPGNDLKNRSTAEDRPDDEVMA